MSSWLHRLGVGAFLGFVAACAPASAQDAESDCRDGTEPAQVIEGCTQTLDPYGKPVWALIRRGHALLDDGQIEAGNADANLAVRAAAKNSDAHALLGRALRDAGDYDAALKSFDRAIALDNDNATAFFYRAQLHYWRDENELALEDIGQSVAIDDANLDFRYWRGVISDESGDHETALKDFSWVIQNDPQNPEYLDSRAWTYFTLGRFPEALGDIDKALALAPDMATPHETRGHVFYSSNRRDDAARELRKALEIDPERSMARQLLAWIDVTAPLPLPETDCGQLGFIRKKLAGLKVELDDGGRAGEPLKLKWSVPDVAIRPDQPVYLVVMMPSDVRFEGHGFFALMPGARGPFGMEYGAGTMRTVTPLSTRGAARSGEISILPYRAGDLPVEWQVVQISACGEKTVLSKGNKATVNVAPGIPELVPLDEGAGGAPVAELRPVNGPFRATIAGNSVGVTNEDSGETVLRVAGANPVFSPSGRFLLVQADNAEVNDVYDLVAVRKLGRFGPARLYWGQGDSFLFVDGIDGRMQVVRTLHGARFAPSEPVSIAASDEDIVTPTGAQGPVPGSEAWDMELSVDAGVVAFGNGWRENAGVAAANEHAPDGEEGDTGAGTDLDGRASAVNPRQGLDVTETGLIVPLGDPGNVNGPMPKYELPAKLIADHGVTRPAPIGWNNHDVLWQARLDAGPRTLGSGSGYVTPVSLATQSRGEPEGSAIAGEANGALRVRPATRLPRPADSSEAAATVAGVMFNHLAGERLATLRAGTDTRAIDHVERELNDVFPTSIAFFEPDASGTVPVQPIPSPYPYLQPEKASSIDLHKGPLDLWAGRAEGGERFWLSQAVVASPAGPTDTRHAMTLLSTAPDGFLRYANLLPLANMVEAMRNLRAINGDFDMRAPGGLGQPWTEPSTVTLTGGRYLTIVTRPVPHLLVFDLKEWRLVCGIARPRDPANVADVMFHADLGHVTQVNRSGQIEVYSCADGGPVLTAMYTDGELVVVDKSGHFEGSAEAASSVAVRLPGVPGRHVLSQFTSRLWVPDLAKRVLAGEAVDPASALDPPALRVASKDGASIDLTARSATALAGIDLIADGRPLRYVEAKGKEAVVSLGPDDLAGHGIMTMVATDKNGVASAPIELLPQRKAGQRAPKLFLLAVGVGSYRQMEDAELQYAAADATRLSKAVARSLYSNTSAVTLTDGDATQQSILENLGRMVAEAGADDIIMLSFAGQGLRGKDGSVRLALSDTNLYEVEGSALDFAAVQAALATAKARVVLLLDVSHASLVKRAEVATNEEVAGLLTSAPNAQMIALSAARGAQASELTTTLSGGRVSVAIRDILVKDRAAADTDGNGNISIHELFRAAKAAVAQESGGRQTPWIARGGIAGDFDIF